MIQVPGLSGVGLGIGEAVLAAGVIVLVARNVPRWKQEREDPLS
jgi:NAD(P)-dependent dehydrogenase (short-subunit alcohol dehydrogenase family)